MGQFERTELLIGKENIAILKQKRVAVFGIGGVGGYTVEALARSGVGTLDLIDNDTVCESNLNRQIIALHSTLGMRKTKAAAARVKDINPCITVNMYNCFYLPENASEFDFTVYDYVVDAVDTVTAKIDIILRAQEAGVPVISSMGAGNKLDPTKFEVADIFETKMDPLAKVMRRELKKRGVTKLKVVYSKEPAIAVQAEPPSEDTIRRSTPGSIAFVPSVAGLIIAGEVIRDLIGSQGEK